MSEHNTFVLALRVISFWSLLKTVDLLGYTISVIDQLINAALPDWELPQGFNRHLVSSALLPLLFQGMAGVGLVLGAPAIASLFYQRDAAQPPKGSDDGKTSGEVFHMALRLLGLYAVMIAIKPFAGFLAYSQLPYEEAKRYLLWNAIEVALLLGFAAVLVFATERLANWLCRVVPSE